MKFSFLYVYLCMFYVNNDIYSPLNTVWTVAKYEPMGTTIMANVKASNLTMTSLVCHSRSVMRCRGKSKQATTPPLPSGLRPS